MDARTTYYDSSTFTSSYEDYIEVGILLLRHNLLEGTIYLSYVTPLYHKTCRGITFIY